MRLPERLWRRSACSNKSVSVTLQTDGSIDRIFSGGWGAGTVGAYKRSRIWPMRPRASQKSSLRAAGKLRASARLVQPATAHKLTEGNRRNGS
jgi:hypothetical protein